MQFMAKEGNPWAIKKESQLRANDSKQNIFLTASAEHIIGSSNPLTPIILTLRNSSTFKWYQRNHKQDFNFRNSDRT